MIENECGGWELNPRIPSKLDLKSSAFDHSTTPAEEIKIERSDF